MGCGLVGIADKEGASADEAVDEALHALLVAGEEGRRHRHDRAGLAGEELVAEGDEPDARIALLDDGQRRLADGRAFHGIGEDRLLGRVDAHGHDLDIGLVRLDLLPEPVLKGGVRHRARRLGRKARRLAGLGAIGAQASAWLVPGLKKAARRGVATKTFSPVAVEATTFTSTPRERATPSGATPAA